GKRQGAKGMPGAQEARGGCLAEQRLAADCLQPPRCFGFRQQLKASVARIDMAHDCTQRTDTSDLWRNRCGNHSYFLMCTPGTSEGLGCWKLQTGSIVGTLRPRAVFAHSDTCSGTSCIISVELAPKKAVSMCSSQMR